MITILAAGAQENYEIQVYGSATQPKGTSIIELHSNYTIQGERNFVGEVRPTYHSLHETIEFTHGITDNFELGLYLFMNYTPDFGFSIFGFHIRPRIKAPDRWDLPVGLSLSTEIGYQRPEFSADTWSLEVRPIIDKQLGKLYASFNPTFAFSLAGDSVTHSPSFAPNAKISYAFFKNGSLGLEYYGDLGPINNFETIPQQSHALFLVFDLLNNAKWELNAGPGWGLTSNTDAFVFKILLGRRIYWGKRKQ